MFELKKKNFTDNTLLSNLDFAERFLREHPLRNDSKLLVKGSYSCAQIGNSSQQVFTITSENNITYVNLCIHNMYDGKVHDSSINANHFFNHSCQNEIKSCFTQAKEAIPKGYLARLQVKCNRFSITYTSTNRNPGPTVETKCQLKLENITAEGLLYKKSWLEKEKPTSHGLIACLDHLIVQYLTTPNAPQINCRFILNADKEVITITSGEEDETEYVLLYVGKSVSMFPPSL